MTLPNAPQGNAPQALKGPISIAIAKDTLFLTTDTTLLEQVLRPGNAPLAESTAYQTVAKEFPEKVSGLATGGPTNRRDSSYDWSRAARSRKPSSKGWPPERRVEMYPTSAKLLPVEKLPDFSVLAKYLSLGGSSSIMDDDGLTMTGFTLRKRQSLIGPDPLPARGLARGERVAEGLVRDAVAGEENCSYCGPCSRPSRLTNDT